MHHGSLAPKKNLLILVIIGLVAAIGLGYYASLNRPFSHQKTFKRCLSEKNYDPCIALGERLIQKSQLSDAHAELFSEVILQKAMTMNNRQAVAFAYTMMQRFPNLTALRNMLPQVEKLRLASLFKQDKPQALAEIPGVLERHPKSADLRLAVGELLVEVAQQEKQETAAKQLTKNAVELFADAIAKDEAIRDKPVIETTVEIALTKLSGDDAKVALDLAENHYFDRLEAQLQTNLKNQNDTLRNNSFALLERRQLLSEAQIFENHWLNLLRGSAVSNEAYHAAVSFFSQNPPPSNPFKAINFDPFPLIDHLPDYSTSETLTLLLELYPTDTKKYLLANLNDKHHDWRRANSFRILYKQAGLSNWRILQYHRINLSLSHYENFTDWLSESIDYFAKRGHSGKQELKTFVSRIVRLKNQQPRNSQHAQVYRQIELYARTNIGKRN